MALFLGGLHWYMAVCQNLVPLVNIKIAGKWMFIPLKMVLIGIDPYPHQHVSHRWGWGSSCSASAAQLEPQLFGRCFWMSGCHPNLGMSSSNGTSKKLAKDGLKMSQRCQIFSRNPHESSSSLELSDQKSWNHGELGTEAPEVELAADRPVLARFRSFLSIRIESICFGVPNFDLYISKPRKPIFEDEFEVTAWAFCVAGWENWQKVTVSKASACATASIYNWHDIGKGHVAIRFGG